MAPLFLHFELQFTNGYLMLIISKMEKCYVGGINEIFK